MRRGVEFKRLIRVSWYGMGWYEERMLVGKRVEVRIFLIRSK